MISVSNFKTKQPLPELQTQTTCLPQLWQRYQKPHGHNISFAYYHGRKLILGKKKEVGFQQDPFPDL